MTNVIFEDVHLIVVDKPAGLLSQGDASEGPNLVDWCRVRFGRPYVGLVHRLDRNTSGLMVVAKRTKSAQRLTQSLYNGTLNRQYLAWLEGSLQKPERWEHWLIKNETLNKTQAFKQDPGRASAKKAALQVTPIKQKAFNGSPVTLVRFQLETGRSHQIRAQSSAQGFPLLGDIKYGAKLGFSRTALHSARLSFPHPMSKETLVFESPLPEDLLI